LEKCPRFACRAEIKNKIAVWLNVEKYKPNVKTCCGFPDESEYFIFFCLILKGKIRWQELGALECY